MINSLRNLRQQKELYYYNFNYYNLNYYIFFSNPFLANISKIKLYLKEREVLKILNNEFPDLYEQPKKLIWENE